MNQHYKVSSKASANFSPIISRLKKIEDIGKFSKIEATPITSRKYQMNAHLAYLNVPILGDYMFGNSRVNAKYYMDYEAVWLKKLSFSISGSTRFFYLNELVIEMDEVFYPNFIFNQKPRKR